MLARLFRCRASGRHAHDPLQTLEYVNPDATQSLTRVGRAVAGESLTLGRAAACKIYLPDPRVRMEHATIGQAEDGHLYLDAQGPVSVNGRAQTRVRLAAGQKLSVGPYEFVVEGVADGPGLAHAQLTLSFAQRVLAVSAGDAATAMPHGGIAPGLLTRRRLSGLFALLVLVLCAAHSHVARLRPQIHAGTDLAG